MLKTNISKKRVLTIISALIIASTSLHTYTVTTQQAKSTQSTQAVPVKTTKPTHATQSVKSTSAQPNTITHTVLKAGYNTTKALGIGLSGFILLLISAANEIKPLEIQLGLGTLIAIPALAESIYNSYKVNVNKQKPKDDTTTTKTIAKTIYNVGKANGIIAFALIMKEALTEKTLLGALATVVSATTIAALGESIYNDYKHLKTKNDTAAATK